MNTMIEIIQADKGTIYVLNGVAYDIHFPLEWAIHPKRLNENLLCCPSDCNNCLEYGSYNGVFIGYCVNCARYYNHERGYGFIETGEEFNQDKDYEEKNSVWNTYLKNVKLDEIGWNNYDYSDKIQENDYESEHRCIDDLNYHDITSQEDDKKVDISNNYYDIRYFDDEGSPLTIEDFDLENQEKENKNFTPIYGHCDYDDYYDIEYFNEQKFTPLTIQDLDLEPQEDDLHVKHIEL